MAYNVSDKYREVIYSGDAQNTAKLTINGTTIPTSNIKKITISSPMYDSSQKTFSLGNFISQQVTIEFRNVDNVPIEGQVHLEIGTKVDNEYEYVPIGDFIIESNPEDFYKKCKLTCLDKAVLMKSNVDYSSIVPTTVETLLKWLCTYFNIEIGTYPNINRDVTINVYDNTLSGKQYISYIAEMMGGNAKIGRDGKLYIIPLKGEPVVTINAKKSKSFTKGEIYEISRVVYESAISKFEYGEDTKNTLYIRQDNMFLTKTEEVEAIYNSVVGTKICSLKTENYGDVSLDSWDYIKYTLGEEEYITYNSNTITYQMNIASKVEVSIPTKNQQETTNVVGGNDKEKIRRLETNINQIEGTITILNEEIDGQNKKIAEIEITNEQIQQSVTKAEESIVELQTITNTLEGNPIKIENALENPLQKLVITGDGEITNDILKVYRKNEQLDYPEIEMKYNPESKNLFDLGDSLNNYFATSTNGTKINTSVNIEDYVSATFTENSITITKYNNSGYRWLSKQINLKKNTTYTISGQNSNIVKVLGFSSLEEGTIGIQLAYIDNQNLTPPKTFYSGNYEFYVISMYPPTNTTISNLQIEEGSNATQYDPFNLHGGQYYVDGITTQQTRNGRQLYNVNDVQTMTSGMTVDEEGWISVSYDNTIGTSTKYFNYFTNNLDLKPNTQYSIITEIKEVSGNLTLYSANRMNNGGQFVNSVSYAFDSSKSNLVYKRLNTTIKSFDGVVYGLRTFVQFSKGQSGSIKFRLSVLEDTTINENNFVYEPYGISPSPSYPSEIINKYPSGTYKTIIENKPYIIKLDDDLRSVGEVADRLWLDITNNIAEVEKKIGKIVLNGSENWNINSNLSNENFKVFYFYLNLMKNVQPVMSNLFTYINKRGSENCIYTPYSIELDISISSSFASDVSTFKQWLSETNTEVQYVLSIPLLQTIQMESIYQQYKLNISSLLTLNETKDEYVLENGKAIIIKKIGINENGEKYVLNTPLISDLGQLYIQLANGVNILEFLNNFNMEATYFIDNEFTRKFANQINSSSEFNEQNNLLNQNSNDINDLSNKLNNDYTNNSKLNQLLEGQKATIIEETSTMVQQSASEVSTRIINKVNTDGVTTLKNTLVTIDINGINVAKNDEDVVSLLDNKGLYVSDGKLKSDESNLLMKTDRNGAYFKSAIIDGTIKEQGLFQKEIIEDDDFGKGQAGFWIGG